MGLQFLVPIELDTEDGTISNKDEEFVMASIEEAIRTHSDYYGLSRDGSASVGTILQMDCGSDDYNMVAVNKAQMVTVVDAIPEEMLPLLLNVTDKTLRDRINERLEGV